MLTANHRKAIELLLSHPDATVAEKIEVDLCVLRKWMRTPEFRAELNAREQEQKASAARLARQAVLNAATALSRATGDTETKMEAKVLLDVLKASGALEDKGEDPGAALAEVIRRVTVPDKAKDG